MNSKYFTGKKLVKNGIQLLLMYLLSLKITDAGIAGKSGSGKSTVLRIIAGLTPQSRYEASCLTELI